MNSPLAAAREALAWAESDPNLSAERQELLRVLAVYAQSFQTMLAAEEVQKSNGKAPPLIPE